MVRSRPSRYSTRSVGSTARRTRLTSPDTTAQDAAVRGARRSSAPVLVDARRDAPDHLISPERASTGRPHQGTAARARPRARRPRVPRRAHDTRAPTCARTSAATPRGAARPVASRRRCLAQLAAARRGRGSAGPRSRRSPGRPTRRPRRRTSASARMPASFRSPTSTSFGHLRRASTPQRDEGLAHAATPAEERHAGRASGARDAGGRRGRGCPAARPSRAPGGRGPRSARRPITTVHSGRARARQLLQAVVGGAELAWCSIGRGPGTALRLEQAAQAARPRRPPPSLTTRGRGRLAGSISSEMSAAGRGMGQGPHRDEVRARLRVGAHGVEGDAARDLHRHAARHQAPPPRARPRG